MKSSGPQASLKLVLVVKVKFHNGSSQSLEMDGTKIWNNTITPITRISCICIFGNNTDFLYSIKVQSFA